jgi:hypothetical protein
MGYAFINFIDSAFILDFYHEYNSCRWSTFNSEKVCRIAYGRIQGKRKLIRHFEKSKVWKNPNHNIKPLVINTKKVDENEVQKILNKYCGKRFKDKMDDTKEDIDFQEESKFLHDQQQENLANLNKNLPSEIEVIGETEEIVNDEPVLSKVNAKRNSSKPAAVCDKLDGNGQGKRTASNDDKEALNSDEEKNKSSIVVKESLIEKLKFNFKNI